MRPAGCKYQLAWMYPPTHMASVLRRLQKNPCHAILVLPKGVHTWTPWLSALPVVAQLVIDWRPGLYRLSSRAPQAWKTAGAMPKRSLHVLRVWPGAPALSRAPHPTAVAPRGQVAPGQNFWCLDEHALHDICMTAALPSQLLSHATPERVQAFLPSLCNREVRRDCKDGPSRNFS